MKDLKIKKLDSFDSAFKLSRILMIVTLSCTTIVASIAIYLAYKTVNSSEKSIYVLAPDGEISLALKSSEGSEREFEYASHVEKAYELWYEFDEASYDRNVDKALYLFGNCGKELLNEYKSEEVKREISAKNIQLFVEVDSIDIRMDRSPVVGLIYGKQTVKRPGGEIVRYVNCQFKLYDSDRSMENPHGVKIEDWVVFNSNTIEDK